MIYILLTWLMYWGLIILREKTANSQEKLRFMNMSHNIKYIFNH